MDATQLLTILLTLLGGLLVGRYGLTRNISALVDSKVKQINTEAEIALKREDTDYQTVKSLRDQFSTVLELLQTQLSQAAKNAADTIISQNNLTGHIREVLDELRISQRSAASNTEEILRAYKMDIEDFKATMRRDVNTIETGFRTISDGFIYQNSQLARVLSKIDNSIDAMNAIVVSIHNETVAIRNTHLKGQESIEEVVDIATYMRNTVVTLTQEKSTAEDMRIRERDDMRPIIIPSNAMLTSQLVDTPTRPIPELQGVEATEDSAQVSNDKNPTIYNKQNEEKFNGQNTP